MRNSFCHAAQNLPARILHVFIINPDAGVCQEKITRRGQPVFRKTDGCRSAEKQAVYTITVTGLPFRSTARGGSPSGIPSAAAPQTTSLSGIPRAASFAVTASLSDSQRS